MQHALKFVTEVRSDSEYADIPEQAIFEIDAASAAGIAALSRKVLDADANKIEVFDYRTTWLKKSAQSDADIEDPENQEAVELDALVASVRELGQLTQVPTPYTDALLGLSRLHARVRGLYPAAA